MNKMDGFSKNLTSENVEKIRSLFPDVIVENKVDIDKLLNLLGEDMNDDFERYQFTWKGKIESLQLAGKRTNATLRPCEDESVNWDITQNLYIEGDNLEVLKLLQQGYHNKVKMCYIDPPYNTGNDFVYKDDFADNIANYKLITEQGATSNSETSGRYHTNWLNLMYPRLRLAKSLLTDDGVMFISIDDNEVHNLRKVCDEVFGEDNFVAMFTWKRRTGSNDAINNVSIDHEYILCYGKTTDAKFGGVKKEFEKYTNPDNDPRGDWARDNLTCNKTASERPNLYYPIADPATGIEYQCNPNRVWCYEKNRMQQVISENKVLFPKDGKGTPMYKRHKAEVRSDTKPFSSIIDTQINAMATKEVQDLFSSQVFSYPKTIDLIKQLLSQTTSDNDIILDFFSGSATAAHAVMQLNAEDGGNRRFIMVQLPEKCDEKSEACKAGYINICEIGKERIRRAGKKILDEKSTQIEMGVEEKPLDVGFRVFKLDNSNLNKWDSTPISSANQLEMDNLYKRLIATVDIFKDDRSDLDIIFEILLKFGMSLNTNIFSMEFEGKTVYSVREDCIMFICLCEDVTVEMVEAMAEFAPGNIIFAEECFKTDSDICNAELVLKERGINIRVI